MDVRRCALHHTSSLASVVALASRFPGLVTGCSACRDKFFGETGCRWRPVSPGVAAGALLMPGHQLTALWEMLYRKTTRVQICDYLAWAVRPVARLTWDQARARQQSTGMLDWESRLGGAVGSIGEQALVANAMWARAVAASLRVRVCVCACVRVCVCACVCVAGKRDAAASQLAAHGRIRRHHRGGPLLIGPSLQVRQLSCNPALHASSDIRTQPSAI